MASINDQNKPRLTESATRKKRFRIVKLEERIAPGGGHGNGSNATCGNIATCQHCATSSASGSVF